jgi:hypothetical protein
MEYWRPQCPPCVDGTQLAMAFFVAAVIGVERLLRVDLDAGAPHVTSLDIDFPATGGYFNVVLREVYVLLTVVPRPLTPAIIAMLIPPAMRAYSMAIDSARLGVQSFAAEYGELRRLFSSGSA